MSDEARYRLTWSAEVHPEGLTPERVPDGRGACDAMLFASIIYPPDGSMSVQMLGVDGRRSDRELQDGEWFKVWSQLAKTLSESKELPMGECQLCRYVFEIVREAVLASRSGPCVLFPQPNLSGERKP